MQRTQEVASRLLSHKSQAATATEAAACSTDCKDPSHNHAHSEHSEHGKESSIFRPADEAAAPQIEDAAGGYGKHELNSTITASTDVA